MISSKAIQVKELVYLNLTPVCEDISTMKQRQRILLTAVTADAKIEAYIFLNTY
jgi:hypothetical protein